LRIAYAKAEVRNAQRNVEEPAEDFGIEGLNPRGGIAKEMEMSCRRSIALHRCLMALLDTQGSIAEVKYRPAIYSDAEAMREIKKALGDTWWHETTWRYGWEYLVDLWASGGIRRGIDTAMTNMPSVNRKRVEKELLDSEMHDDEDLAEYIRKEQFRERKMA